MLDLLRQRCYGGVVPDDLTDVLPDPVIEEFTEDPTLDDWVPDFPIPRPGHERVDSRRWLLLPERYTYKPLRALDAARATDAFSVLPYALRLTGIAVRLMNQRRGEVALLRREVAEALAGRTDAAPAVTEDEVQAEADRRMVDHVASAMIDMIGDGFQPITWALGWLERCQVHRCPLPSRREGANADPGGFVHQAKGAGEWTTYYAGRQAHVVRLAAAACWGSIGPFLVDPSLGP